MQIIFTVLLVLFVAVSAKFAERADELFEDFKKSYGRVYVCNIL
jgi:hypothetical protein